MGKEFWGFGEERDEEWDVEEREEGVVEEQEDQDMEADEVEEVVGVEVEEEERMGRRNWRDQCVARRNERGGDVVEVEVELVGEGGDVESRGNGNKFAVGGLYLSFHSRKL